jgi:glycosyltransferase involved in cell wall biosynthesis
MILIYGYAVRELGGKITGGVATYIFTLIEGLKDIRLGLWAENVGFFKKNFGNVTVYGPPSKRWFLREILFSKTFKPNSRWLWDSRLGIILKELNPRVFYSHIPHSPANTSENLKKLRFVVNFPSTHAYDFEREGKLKQEFYRNMRYSYERADAVIFLSSKVKGRVFEIFGEREGVVINPVVRVPNWGFSKEESREILGLSGDVLVGFAGMMVGRKGEDILIKASVGKDWKLVFAGGGPNFENTIVLAKKLGVDAVFLGDIYGEMLWHFYNSIDIFCLPSRSETFGIAVVEAMLFGKKVVVSEEIPEEVAPKEIAIRVPLDPEAVSEGIERATKWEIKAEKIREYALKFSDVEDFVRKHREVLGI